MSPHPRKFAYDDQLLDVRSNFLALQNTLADQGIHAEIACGAGANVCRRGKHGRKLSYHASMRLQRIHHWTGRIPDSSLRA